MKLNIKDALKKIFSEKNAIQKKSESNVYKVKQEQKTARKKTLYKQTLQLKIANQKEKKQFRENALFKTVHITKALAQSGIGSRRYCDELISKELVMVNNKLAQIGQTVNFDDYITVKGKPIKLTLDIQLPRIIVYHKQEGEIVTRDDPQKRITVFDKIPVLKNKRFIVIGRLDINTSGLLIFTTSGTLANNFMHPKFMLEREYCVRIYSNPLTLEQIKAFKQGIMLEDGIAKFKDIQKLSLNEDEAKNHWYKVSLTEGKNREIRRMFAHFNITVSRLIRTKFGPIELPSRLKRGQYYELSPLEVKNVMEKISPV